MRDRIPIDPGEVVRRVGRPWDEARVERALDAQLREHRRRRVRRSMLAVATVAAAAAAVWLVVTHVPEPAPVATTEPTTSAGAREAPPIELADGSVLAPAPGARLRMEEISESRVRATLLSGSVAVDIVPRPGREVSIHCGTVTVTVLGTAFRVARVDVQHVGVSVARGRVRVRWTEGGEARTEDLTLGMEGTYLDESEVSGPRAPAPSEAPVPEVETPAPPTTEPGPTVAARRPRRDEETSSWQTLAQRGEFDDAYDALQEGGGAVNDELDELLLAADAARLSGHPREALPYLSRAEAQAAGDPRGALAAFSSGRILAQLGRDADAAAAFDRALALEPDGAIAEHALARSVEAHRDAGDTAQARVLARRYAERYPTGRWRERMDAIAEE